MNTVFKSGKHKELKPSMPFAKRTRKPSPHGKCVSRGDLVLQYNRNCSP